MIVVKKCKFRVYSATQLLNIVKVMAFITIYYYYVIDALFDSRGKQKIQLCLLLYPFASDNYAGWSLLCHINFH